MSTYVTDTKNITDHPSYFLADEIAEICAPLFDNFSINYFCYTKTYLDNNEARKAAVLISNKEWWRYYFQSNHPFITNGKKVHSWASTMPAKARQAATTNPNLYNGILMEKRHSDCIEGLEFASPNQNFSVELCGNKDLLNQFFSYFKNRAANIIAILGREIIHIPKSRCLKIEDPDQPYTEFCQAIKTRKLSLRFRTQEVIFSRREFDILSLLIKGKTMREIASILKISPRTVETYLYTAKDKTNTFTVGRLLDCFAESLF